MQPVNGLSCQNSPVVCYLSMSGYLKEEALRFESCDSKETTVDSRQLKLSWDIRFSYRMLELWDVNCIL